MLICRRIKCVACLNLVSDNRTLRAPCGDYYCKSCIVEFVNACTRDESVFPLRCCNQTIPHNSILPLLPTSLQSFLHSKRVELGVAATNRIYCPSQTCSAFLGSSEGAKGNITCHECSSVVCAMCKQTAHPDETCSENAATEEVRTLARAERWQTCPECHAIIELHQGCYHVTCRCRAQFCYLCGVSWKRCSCPQWEEGRIVLQRPRGRIWAL